MLIHGSAARASPPAVTDSAEEDPRTQSGLETRFDLGGPDQLASVWLLACQASAASVTSVRPVADGQVHVC